MQTHDRSFRYARQDECYVSFTTNTHPNTLGIDSARILHTLSIQTTHVHTYTPPGGGSVLLGRPRRTGTISELLDYYLLLVLALSCCGTGYGLPKKRKAVLRAGSVVTRLDFSTPITVKFPCPALTHRFARFARHTTGYVSYFHWDLG